MYFVFACLGALPVLAMAIYQYFSVAGNAAYACITGTVPADAAAPQETSLLASSKTAFPAGRYCEWESSSGGITTYQTGWITTILACVATILVVLMTILAIRERSPRKLFVALIPALLALVAWVTVFV
ncbi:hypothetical protein [Microbacterium yannicii]|uniref:hypothetical protein n=1 Tax=Microbacterium yannicii TaxID=671622 RepID=UPI00036A26AE|nr:hypothetical protein [Microbacterium yannicii]